MSLSTIATRAALVGLLLALTAVLASPARAQISFGSPNDPPRAEIGIGAFDITPSTSHRDAHTAAEFRGEYHFRDTLWILAPFVGGMTTSDGAAYGYGGLAFDVNFTPNWVLTPSGAMGFFERGAGTRLGSWFEFRTGAEFAYRFADQTRLGVGVTHTSNAGLTKRNPGEQSVVLTYSVPMQ